MTPTYRDRDSDVWMYDADTNGYYTDDMYTVLPIEEVRELHGPLEVRAGGSRKWVREAETETLEQLLRRVIREELDRRVGKVHG
ncbi:hypothetical protein [Streptomyces fulvorobeus]|uniref:Uncharacterized protein n=1 Tax=Streptomyces fulvorobeus TaxID=284028 RepID=A0A7J0CE98_9ACTN|nr:hypothetical protein [Streptomyces fulvorobeus]NYE44224.1 hypothetical protein [Streptomyces fulvorobeus]GFN00739.1 hypothetical protein Sfulv_55490 [Streptomyces fulvorobeus]